VDAGALEQWCTEFVEDTRATLCAVLPGIPQLIRDIEVSEERLVAAFDMCIDLRTRQTDWVARLVLAYRIGTDRSGRHIAVHNSSFKVGIPRQTTQVLPAIRYEYDREPRRWVSAHIHVHAENGMLTRVRTLAGKKAPDELRHMHYPVGGDRFRPCLEDFLYFLIEECGFQSKKGWEQALTERRDDYRRKQARSVIRDYHDEAAEVLRALGYTVTGAPTSEPNPPHREW
jgi:hypothetical protein